ncbi:PspC domain-containing protein [Salinibacterium sp. SYSU T00001]|uniref:PspC domain-containing protein n=1 Tax=Homoserinimonas sedimenticola TaxID=2986805 RepID=UPI00223571CA|nr:PspC domain-containing protein [Salinibacterium sedimenticola]MCW4385265.1 PspC domain-containing protein [Salinibacterium sedimenticola]
MDNDSPSQTPPPSGGSAADSGFFPWLRGLGVTREAGWLGGVCAGLAARLGIDPLIVRGIVVVIAIFGGPALILYAAAWLLLPDAAGRIHLQELFRGVFDRALAGIGILVLLALLPFGGGWWWFGGWWFDGWGDLSVGAIIWTLLLTASAVWLVVWLANRPQATGPTASVAGSTPDDARADATASADPTADAPVAEPVAPPAPPKDAAEADLAAWREGQAEWKREHDAWRAQQAASAHEAQRARLAAERERRRAEAAERARVARERERRTRPGAGYSLVAIGLALVAGAATALGLADTDLTFAMRTSTALAATLAVLALAIIVNGLRGRRSGGSGGVAVLVVIALLLSGVFGGLRAPVISERQISWSPTASDDRGLRTVVSGDVTLDLEDYFDDDSRLGTLDLLVVSGDVDVLMPADADGRVEVDIVSGTIRVDGDVADAGSFSSAVARYDAHAGEDRRMLVDIYVISGDVTVAQAD